MGPRLYSANPPVTPAIRGLEDSAMPKLSPEAIRTLALAGHGGSGKTTLAEALLARAGAITTMGSVEKGTTDCDFDPLEKQYLNSLNASVVHLRHGQTRG